MNTKHPHYIPRKSYLDYFTDNAESKPYCLVYNDKKLLLNNIDLIKPLKLTPLNLCKEEFLPFNKKIYLNTSF
jgi:hypothetical protein